jgi:vacuolar-type H+-ATPase subunit F/Vma7
VDFHVIGEEEVVLGFAFVGVAGSVVRTPEEARAAFRDVTAGAKARILILTEKASQMIGEDVMAWQMDGTYPLIVEIPGLSGHIEGRTSLVDAIREAVGVRV